MHDHASEYTVTHRPNSLLIALAGLLLASPALGESGDVPRLKSEQAEDALELDRSQERYRRSLDSESLPPTEQRALERQLERERLDQERLQERQLTRERAASRREQSQHPDLTSPDRARDQTMRRERDAQSLQFKMQRNRLPPSKLE